MNFEFNQSGEASRFVLALMLSSATAILVAGPFLLFMMRSDNTTPASPTSQTVVEEQDTRPAPSLGTDEAEVGRIDEADPRDLSSSGPAVPVPEQELRVERPTSTTAGPTTTVAPTTTTTPPSLSNGLGP